VARSGDRPQRAIPRRIEKIRRWQPDPQNSCTKSKDLVG